MVIYLFIYLFIPCDLWLFPLYPCQLLFFLSFFLPSFAVSLTFVFYSVKFLYSLYEKLSNYISFD